MVDRRKEGYGQLGRAWWGAQQSIWRAATEQMSWLIAFLLFASLLSQRARFRHQARAFWAAMDIMITKLNRIYVLHERLYGGEDVKQAELVEGFVEFNDSLIGLQNALEVQ